MTHIDSLHYRGPRHTRFRFTVALAVIFACLSPGCGEPVDARSLWDAHRELVLDGGELPRAGRILFTQDTLGLVTKSTLEYALDGEGGLAGCRVTPLTVVDQGLIVWLPEGGWEKTTGGAVRRLSPRENEQVFINTFLMSGAYLETEPISQTMTGSGAEVVLEEGGAVFTLGLDGRGRLTDALVSFPARGYAVDFGGPVDEYPRLPESLDVTSPDFPGYAMKTRDFREVAPEGVDLTPPEPSGLVYDYAAERIIPLRLVNSMLLLPVTIGDLELEFALDSGAAISYVRPDVARRLELSPMGESMVISLGNEATGHGVALVEEIRVGPATLENQPVIIGEPSLFLSLATSFDGLIGYDLLAQLPVRLDIEAGTLEIIPPGTGSETSPDAVVIPLSLPGRLLQVPGELDGAGGLDFILDSGSPLELLVLPQSTGSLMGLSSIGSEGYTYMSLAGLGGFMSALMREVGYYQVGSPTGDPGAGRTAHWRVLRPKVTFAVSDNDGPLSYMDADALLGLPFLMRFSAVTFDYPRERLILEPRAAGED